MVEQSAFQQIGASLGDITGGVPTSGSFAYDPDQLRAIIAGWNDLSSSYRNSWERSVILTQVDGPGLDYASGQHAMDANVSGRSYRAALDRAVQYCAAQAGKYQSALDSMLGTESANAHHIARSGSTDDGRI